MILKIKTEYSSWVLLVPVTNLQLTEAVNYEYHAGRVTFLAASVLPGRRKRFGLPQRVSELKGRGPASLEDFFGKAETFAVLRWSGKPEEFEGRALECVRDELALLTLSQLGYAKRWHNSAPTIVGEGEQGRHDYLVVDSKTAGRWYQSLGVYGKLLPLTLDQRWLDFTRDVFHRDLMRILRRQVQVEKGWWKDLRNAAALAGQSQASLDLPQAFLWNVITIELLLTQRGDTYSDALPSRAEAFVGWAADWRIRNYEAKIKEMYRKRSALVHAGRRDVVEYEDLFFTDVLVLNLLTNIAGHPKLFSSKEKVLEFATKVEAERVLGVKEKVRPKGLRFLSQRYTDRDNRLY